MTEQSTTVPSESIAPEPDSNSIGSPVKTE